MLAAELMAKHAEDLELDAEWALDWSAGDDRYNRYAAEAWTVRLRWTDGCFSHRSAC